MLPCHSPNPHMPECQPNLCSPSFPIFSGLLFSCSITPQPPFTCHPLSHPFPRPSHPSSYQILPPFRAQFVPQFAPPEILQKRGEKNPGFHTYFALIACRLHHHHHHHHCRLSLISSTVSPSPFHPLSCSPVCWCSGSVHSPRQPSLGSQSSPCKCSLGDTKLCQLPMSLLERNTVGQADARTHSHIQRERKLPEHSLPSSLSLAGEDN